MSVDRRRRERFSIRLSSTLSSLHRNFFAAVNTLALNTGLAKALLMPWKGFIIAFTQVSYTSPKNSRIASSVCGLVGFVGIVAALPAPAEAEARASREVEGALVVYDWKGGNMCGFWEVL